MKTAFIQSVGGASGDMLLGALLDSGLPPDAVREAVAALDIPGVAINTADETRCEVRGTRALVDVSGAPRFSPPQMLDAVDKASALSDQTRVSRFRGAQRPCSPPKPGSTAMTPTRSTCTSWAPPTRWWTWWE